LLDRFATSVAQVSMTQVRLPPHPQARWLHVYQLLDDQQADWSHEPTGSLLAQLPIP
jgi:hypothetical protein